MHSLHIGLILASYYQMKKKQILTALALFVVFLIYMTARLLTPLPYGNTSMEFKIDKGMTYRQVVDAMAQKKLIRDRWVFLFLGRLTNITNKVKAGYYPIWGNMSPWQIFRALKLGKIIEYEITVVPGDSLMEIGDKFSALGIMNKDEFNKLCVNRDLLNSLDIDAPSLEGYLFPETYKFPKGLDAQDILSNMVYMLRGKYNAEMFDRTYALKLNERDVLTMASIIEKEAVVDSERPVIAGVYYNRLKKKMPLQADPTATYGIKSSSEKILKQDLMRKTRYNTYTINGLPPGPIASPGLKSIIAALYPADVPYLYFVSNNDGTHNFSTTLSSHTEAVRAYREKKKG